ncbi:MAG: response regulator transcription factor [Treponema sp.]|jgi:two-component system phosphate regulon response regulator PhoB|nr:response regulator transcription factor [Treponema sp.]
MKILIVDDEEPIRELIKYNVEKEGFLTFQAENGTSALNLARDQKPDIIILDLMLSDMSGLDVCRVLKNDSKTTHIPIIMVTAKTEDSDIVAGLELGADDYITKPFSPKVLIARIRSVLRRIQEAAKAEKDSNNINREIVVHNLRIIPLKHEVYVDNNLVQFSATEFAILEYLASHTGQVFSRKQIINEVNGDSYPVTERSIDVQILSIRRKIEQNLKKSTGSDSIIETIRGVGYRMKEPDDQTDQ